MKTYILGPMRGKHLFNFPAFDLAATYLQSVGNEVVNPAELDRKAGFDPSTLPDCYDWNQMPLGLDLDTVIRRDVMALLHCDSYVALDGWEKSVGACAEKALLDWKQAKHLNLSIDPNSTKGFDIKNYPTRWETEKGVPTVKPDRTNPKDKLGMKKPPLHLIPASALIYLSRVMALGAKKYGPGNWRQHPVKLTVYLSAAWRHLLQCLDGEDTDPESGMPHIAHAMACNAIILDAQACGCLIDDRPPKGAASKLIDDLTEKQNPDLHKIFEKT